MQNPIPILRSFDENKTREFYINFLGFEVLFEHRFDEKAPLYMGLVRGECEIHVSEHHGDGTPGTFVRIGMNGLDEYCKELNDKKYQNARPGIQEQTWGMREMSISDPAGNKLIFCTPIEN